MEISVEMYRRGDISGIELSMATLNYGFGHIPAWGIWHSGLQLGIDTGNYLKNLFK